MNENITVVVFGGPYDLIEAIEYKGGVPRIVFEDSTHADIQLSSDWSSVTIALVDQNGKKTVKRLKVDRAELDQPR